MFPDDGLNYLVGFEAFERVFGFVRTPYEYGYFLCFYKDLTAIEDCQRFWRLPNSFKTMKFSINRDHFSTGLQQVLNVVGPRPSMPILNNVLIQAGHEHLSLATTNLDMGIRCRIKADVSTHGSITLPVRKLATIVKSLPNVEVEVSLDDKLNAQITSGGSTFRLSGIDESEFPALTTFEDQHVFNVKQDKLAAMLRNVSYAQSNDENRYVLNGSYLIFEDNQMTLVATDGRRLALMSQEIPVPEEDAGSVIIPAKAVGELTRLLGQGENVKITFTDRQIAFEIAIDEDGSSGLVDNTYLLSKIIEGNYPNYKQVIPKETDHRIKIERELFADSIRRASLMTSDKNQSVTLSVSTNLLEIVSSTPEFGECQETMAIAWEGETVQVAFNPAYMLDPLRALTQDEVYFEFKDHLSPGVIKTLDSFLCVVMPLRLK